MYVAINGVGTNVRHVPSTTTPQQTVVNVHKVTIATHNAHEFAHQHLTAMIMLPAFLGWYQVALAPAATSGPVPHATNAQCATIVRKTAVAAPQGTRSLARTPTAIRLVPLRQTATTTLRR